MKVVKVLINTLNAWFEKKSRIFRILKLRIGRSPLAVIFDFVRNFKH